MRCKVLLGSNSASPLRLSLAMPANDQAITRLSSQHGMI